MGLSVEDGIILLLIAVLAFYFWRWLFRRFVSAGHNQSMALWLSILVSSIAAYLGLAMFLIFLLPYESNLNFDQNEWGVNKHYRYKMADDLIDRKILINKDEQQISTLLGAPTWSDKSHSLWVYDMGISSGAFGYVYQNLAIKFSHNKVISVMNEKIH